MEVKAPGNLASPLASFCADMQLQEIPATEILPADFYFFFLTVCVCWSSLSLFSSWTLSSPSLGAIGVRACRLSRPDRSQEKRDPFLICQRTCRALFDLPDDLLFSSSLFSYTYPPLSFPTTTTTFFTLKKTQIRDCSGESLASLLHINGPRSS